MVENRNRNRKMYKAASERGLGLSKDLRCKFSCNKTKLVQFSCVTDSRRRCARQHSVMRSAPTALVSPGEGKWTAHAKKKGCHVQTTKPHALLDKSLTCVALEIITNKNLENLPKKK